MRSRVVGLVGVLALSSACATSTGSVGSHRFEAAPLSSARRPTPAEADSIVAQTVADREGPRVDIRAEFTNASNSRLLRASFNVVDDAYVLIGYVDGDGIVRLVFPTNPRDDGFVRGGGHSYQTPEFFAGFEDAYRFRAQTLNRFAQYNPDSYDNSLGYLFIVASWRPMHFEKFSTEGVWDSFETVDAAYNADPRPAIYELAALLNGDNREAYTVKFARYFNSRGMGYGGYQTSAFSTGGMCNASAFGIYSGFGFSDANLPYMMAMSQGSVFWYRGQQYAYDAARDCAYALPYGYGFGGNPFFPFGAPGPRTTPANPRRISAEGYARKPIEPIVPRTPGRVAPVIVQGIGSGNTAETRHFSPEYRQRGLITEDQAGANAPARGTTHLAIDQMEHTRPSISQMAERRVHDQRESWNYSDWNRGQAHVETRPSNGNSRSNGSNDGWNRTPRVNDGGVDRGGYRAGDRTGVDRSQPRSFEPGTSSGYTPPARTSEPTHSRPAPMDSPRSAPASTPRMSVPSSPPPAAQPASTQPASSSSSSSTSTGKPPR